MRLMRPLLNDAQRHLQAHRRYFSAVRLLASVWRKCPFLGAAIAQVAARLHPQQEAPAYAKSWPEGSWNRYLATVGLGTALLYEAGHLAKLMQVQWHDPKSVLGLLRERGGALLTFHHPLAYLFPALIGGRGIPVEVLARTPQESALSPLIESHMACWFSGTQPYFGGGQWCFQHTDRTNDMRRPLLALRDGRVVISLHDFPNIYPGAQTISGRVLGHELLPAQGIIGPALRRRVPIALGYTQWLGGRRFAVTLGLITSGDEHDLTAEAVLARYLRVLETILVKEPEFWEVWGALPPDIARTASHTAVSPADCQ
jgi:hypothetical protein